MRLAVLLSVALALSGCVHTQPERLGSAEGRAAVNARTAHQNATLILRSGPGRPVRALRVGPEETTWVDRTSGAPESAPTSDVLAVTFRRRGALRAVAIGAAAGATASIVSVLVDRRNAFPLSPAVAIISSAELGALIGGVVGFSREDRYRGRDAAQPED